MGTAKLLISEIRHRKLNFAVCLAAITLSATMLVAGPMIVEGYTNDATEKIAGEEDRLASELEETKRMHQRQLARLKQSMEDDLKEIQKVTDEELQRMTLKAEKELAALSKATRKMMVKLGFNLRIVHKDTDMTSLYTEFKAVDMPETYVETLAKSPELTKVVHLVATVKSMEKWEGRKRLVVGFAAEATQTHIGKKPPMGFQIAPGTAFLGHEAGIGHKVNDEVDILGKKFKIARILPENGNHQDIMVAMHLKDAQEVLKKQGKISEILALGCKCETIERLAEIREQLEKVMPQTKITEMGTRAMVRAEQRKLVDQTYKKAIADYRASRKALLEKEAAKRKELIEKTKIEHQKIIDELSENHSAIISNLHQSFDNRKSTMQGLVWITTPLVIVAAVVFVGIMSWTNVRERRAEIGILRALGRDTVHIASLFLGKAVLLGLVGGILGCLIGAGLAVCVGQLLEIATAYFTASPALLAATILLAPIAAAAASYLPTRAAIRQDPAIVLMEQ